MVSKFSIINNKNVKINFNTSFKVYSIEFLLLKKKSI